MSAVEQIQPLARILDVSEEQYFADPCQTPSLSQSIAKVLVTQSPLHAWTYHPKLGALENPDIDVERQSKQKDDGHIVHRMLLGKGADVEIVHGFDNWKKKAAQTLRDEIKEAGRLPVLAHHYEDLEAASETIKGNLMTQFGIDLNEPGGESEIALEWSEDGANGPVLCRGRMDRIQFNRGLIYDVKTIYSAHPEVCGKQAVELGRDIQNAAYTSAVSKLRPDLAGRVEMLFLHVEIEPPYAIYPGPLDGELRELGRQRWERAIYVWEECLRTGRWPAYTNRITPIRAPGWAVTRWMEKAQDW